MQIKIYLFIPFLALALAGGTVNSAESTKLGDSLQNAFGAIGNVFKKKEGAISNGGDMKKLQQHLNNAGYNAGFADGQFGGKTRAAIQAYQRSSGLPVDGKPTYALLKQLKTVTKGSQNGANSNAQLDVTASRCIDTRTAEGRQLVDAVFEKTVGNLPIDIRPYLAGYCLPKRKDLYEDLYLYLIATGATHARLTLIKYQELVVFYEKAGVDLGVRRDAFQRSIDSLRTDYRTLAEDRRKGAKKLLKTFENKESEKLLKALPAGYANLKGQYKAEARVMMSEALSHSTSATFFLTRSVATAKSLLELAKVKKQKSGGFFDKAASMVAGATEKARLGLFVAARNKEVKVMLYASALSVKTLTQDIKDVPSVNQKQAHRELVELRGKSGVMLNGFEAEFEEEQTDQLRNLET